MDDIVARAIPRWPDVPAVYGWLSLDRRGNWAIKGERVRNRLMAKFIARNYDHDERGRWFFQNGPQRVFVRLAYTPLVYRTRPGEQLMFASHTGQPADDVRYAWLDDQGALLIETGLGIGVLHDRDLSEALAHLTLPDATPLPERALEQYLDQDAGGAAPAVQLQTRCGPVPLSPIRADTVAQRFRFDPDPRPAPGEPEC